MSFIFSILLVTPLNSSSPVPSVFIFNVYGIAWPSGVYIKSLTHFFILVSIFSAFPSSIYIFHSSPFSFNTKLVVTCTEFEIVPTIWLLSMPFTVIFIVFTSFVILFVIVIVVSPALSVCIAPSSLTIAISSLEEV